MTAQRIEPDHEPRVISVRCEGCRQVRSCTSLDRCPQCGERGTDPAEVLCDYCVVTWPCQDAVDQVDVALRRWADDDYALRAAAEIVVRTGLRDKMVPRYIEWGPYGFVARPAFDRLARDYADGDAYLSGSELTLFRLAANLAHGPDGAGSPLDLRGLWNLGDANCEAVRAALIPAMRRRPALAVAR